MLNSRVEARVQEQRSDQVEGGIVQSREPAGLVMTAPRVGPVLAGLTSATRDRANCSPGEHDTADNLRPITAG